MKFDVLTLFPEMFKSLEESIIGKAKEKNLCVLSVWKRSMVPSERNDCRRSRHVFKDTRQGSDGRRTLWTGARPGNGTGSGCGPRANGCRNSGLEYVEGD